MLIICPHFAVRNRFLYKITIEYRFSFEVLLKHFKNIEGNRNKRYNFGQEMCVLHRCENNATRCDSCNFGHPVNIKRCELNEMIHYSPDNRHFWSNHDN